MTSTFSLKHITLIILLIFQSAIVCSQVTVGSNVPPAEGTILDLKQQASDGNYVTATKGGLVLPRVKLVNTTTLRPFINTTDADYSQQTKLHQGMIVYNITSDATENLQPGIYQWDGSNWLFQKELKYPNPWYDVATQAPTTDNSKNVYLSAKAVIGGNTIASVNGEDAILTVIGGDAAINSITVGKGKSNRSGNTSLGTAALGSNDTGDKNTGIGFNTLSKNTTGQGNTAIGYNALSQTTVGNNNTIIGNNSGSTLTTGSSNIFIGNNIDSSSPSQSNRMNIGNSIFGTNGSTLTNTGSISIGTDSYAGTSKLHIDGNMILKDAEDIIDGEALLIDDSGNMGIGALLPTPTPHTFYQSSSGHQITGTDLTNFNGSTGYRVIWDNSDILSNNMTDFQSDYSLKFKDGYSCMISGFIGFQFLREVLPAQSEGEMRSTSTGIGAALLIIEKSEDNGSTWNPIASGYQIWYGAAIASTVKVIQIPPTVVEFKKDDRIRMILKKAPNIGINQTFYGTWSAITRPNGSLYSKGLTIVALK